MKLGQFDNRLGKHDWPIALSTGFLFLFFFLCVGVYEPKPEYWQAIWLLPNAVAAGLLFFLGGAKLSVLFFYAVPFTGWHCFWLLIQALHKGTLVTPLFISLLAFVGSIAVGAIVVYGLGHCFPLTRQRDKGTLE